MPTKTIILLAAIVGIILLIVIAIVITVIATGNVLAKNSDEERPNANYLMYVKRIGEFKCPKCGSELKLFTGEDKKTYYRCKNVDNCDYIVDPEELLKENK